MKNRIIPSLQMLVFASTFLVLTAHSQTYMTSEELMSKVVGHTLAGTGDRGDKWEESYALPKKKGKAKGKIRGKYEGEHYKGTWKIKEGGVWCTLYPKWPSSNGCGYLELIGESHINYYDESGVAEVRYPSAEIIK